MGFGATVLVAAVEAALLWFLLDRSVDLGSFLLALLALLAGCLLAILGYYLYALWGLSYEIEAENLTVVWGLERHVIPLATVGDVLTDEGVFDASTISGVNLPGCLVGKAYGDEIGQITCFATSASPQHLLVVVTDTGAYALSPSGRLAFLNQLNFRRASAVSGEQPVRVVLPSVATLSFWQDRVGQLTFLAALVGNAIIYAYVSFKYPDLPPLLPLHYNAFGEIDFIGARAEAFKIPAIGSIVLSVNAIATLLLHGRERMATYLLAATALLVQLILLVATIKIVY